MAHTYSGDIEGTLDEVLDPYDLETLGIYYNEFYEWPCGCKTLIDETCECCREGYEELDHYRDGELDTSYADLCHLEYYVGEHDVASIKESVKNILESFGNYKEEILNETFANIPENLLQNYKKLYAKYKIGIQILDYIKDTDVCVFYINM